MRNPFILIIATVMVFGFYSCAKMPIESVQLMDAITSEGERMHKMNIALLNNLLSEKKMAVKSHVKVFEAKQIAEITKTIKDQGIDMNNPEELSGFFTELKSYINNYEDSLTQTLQVAHDMYAEKLNSDYVHYNQACVSVKNLLNSAVKVNKARQSMLQQLVNISGQKADVQQLENLMDEYILKGGSAADKAASFLKNVEAYLNKK